MKVLCEFCESEVNTEKDIVEGIIPTLLICPSCGEALDQDGFVWDDNPFLEEPEKEHIHLDEKKFHRRLGIRF